MWNKHKQQTWLSSCNVRILNPNLFWFNQSVSSNEPEQTAVGYFPIVLAPAHEYDTLNTVVKRCMAISSHFGQEHTVITVDQALYCKLMELKWCVEEYQGKLIPRLGGLHIAMNFLKTIGDWIAGGGCCAACHVRESIQKGYESSQTDLAGPMAAFVANIPRVCCRIKQGMPWWDFCYGCWWQSWIIPQLITYLKQEQFDSLLKDFIASKSEDVHFVVWWNYMDMVSTLLQFTQAQRDGLWELHLHYFSWMLPYFMRYDHLNYASRTCTTPRTCTIRVPKGQLCCKAVRSTIQPGRSRPSNGVDQRNREKRRGDHWHY